MARSFSRAPPGRGVQRRRKNERHGDHGIRTTTTGAGRRRPGARLRRAGDRFGSAQQALRRCHRPEPGGPARSLLYDDLATLRAIRAPLTRIGIPALNQGDVPKAAANFKMVEVRFPEAYDLLKVRSAKVADDAKMAMADLSSTFAANGTADELKSLVAVFADRYGFGTSLVDAAARNSDLSKKTHTNRDLFAVSGLGDVEIQLAGSLALWQAGTFAEAASAAALAGTAAFSRAQPVLADKGADAVLKKAIDGYSAMAGTPGDPAVVTKANTSAVEAVAVAR